MNELANSLRLMAEQVCIAGNVDSDTTVQYLEMVDRCSAHIESLSNVPEFMHISEALQESQGASTILDFANFSRLVLFGSAVVTDVPPTKARYAKWAAEAILVILSVYYYQGYQDGLHSDSPDVFDDFVSSLDIDGK